MRDDIGLPGSFGEHIAKLKDQSIQLCPLGRERCSPKSTTGMSSLTRRTVGWEGSVPTIALED